MLKISKKFSLEPKPERLNKMALVLVFGVFIAILIVWEILFAKELSRDNSYKSDFYSSPSGDTWFEEKPDYIEQEKKSEIVVAAPIVEEVKAEEPKIKDNTGLYGDIFAHGIGVKFKLSQRADSLWNAEMGEENSTLSLFSGSTAKEKEAPDILSNKLLSQTENKISEYLDEEVMNPRSKYELKVGTVIPSLLLTSIDSDLPGEIIGQVREDVYDTVSGRYLLIPKGTKIFGKYNSSISYGQERLLVVWNRLIFPNGSSLTLNGMPGVSASGQAGFEADVNNHYARVFGGAILMSVITAGVQLSQPQESKDGNGPSTQQTLAASLGQNIGNVAAEMTRKNLEIQPTLKQKYGYRFNVMVTKDLVFPGIYQGR